MTQVTLEPSSQFAIRLFWMEWECVIVLISYLMGSIPFGFLIAKARGIDIRDHGSGNIGATNVMRVLGKGPGYTVFTCDTIKGLMAVIIAKLIATRHGFYLNASYVTYQGVSHIISHDTKLVTLPASVAAITAAFACIIGHNFPIWLGFKGGKGMATSCGVVIGMMPLTAIGSLTVWAIVFLTTRYVSLASIAAAVALPVWTIIFLFTGLLTGWPYFYFTVLACILAIVRHRSNIVRLLNGTENRFEKKPKTPEPVAQ